MLARSSVEAVDQLPEPVRAQRRLRPVRVPHQLFEPFVATVHREEERVGVGDVDQDGQA